MRTTERNDERTAINEAKEWTTTSKKKTLALTDDEKIYDFNLN